MNTFKRVLIDMAELALTLAIIIVTFSIITPLLCIIVLGIALASIGRA